MGTEAIEIRLPPAVWAARKLHAPNGITKVASHFIHCTPMSITAQATAVTTYGTNGVKIFPIFEGEILEHDPMAQDKKMSKPQRW